jgi:hypothetical protein
MSQDSEILKLGRVRNNKFRSDHSRITRQFFRALYGVAGTVYVAWFREHGVSADN